MRGGFSAAATAGLFILTSASPSAHRLDEYLQATRVSLERSQVLLEIDLTPGSSVAEGIIRLIDRDGDSSITPLEAESYGRSVLSDVLVDLDDRRISMTLAHVEVPSTDEMRHGMGTIQVRAAGDVEQAALWRRQRQLHLRNNHHAASSVYLVNALMPGDAGVSVISQTRDRTQREARIEYRVSPQWPKYVYWPVIGLVVGGWWLVRTRTVSSAKPV